MFGTRTRNVNQNSFLKWLRVARCLCRRRIYSFSNISFVVVVSVFCFFAGVRCRNYGGVYRTSARNRIVHSSYFISVPSVISIYLMFEWVFLFCMKRDTLSPSLSLSLSFQFCRITGIFTAPHVMRNASYTLFGDLPIKLPSTRMRYPTKSSRCLRLSSAPPLRLHLYHYQHFDAFQSFTWEKKKMCTVFVVSVRLLVVLEICLFVSPTAKSLDISRCGIVW